MSGLAAVAEPVASASSWKWNARLRGLLIECQARPCRRFTVTHRLLRRDGIYLGDAWYCSAACLKDALHLLLTRRSAPGPVAAPRRVREPFHYVLLRRGVLTEADLQRALRLAAEQDLRLEQVLLHEELASSGQLAAAKAAEAGVPFLASGVSALPPAARLPRHLMERYRAATMHASATSVLIGFSDQIEPLILRAAAAINGSIAEVCMIPPELLEAQLEACAATSSPTEKTTDLEDACARIVTCALTEAAEVIRAEVGPDWVWARLSGKSFRDVFFTIGPGRKTLLLSRPEKH